MKVSNNPSWCYGLTKTNNEQSYICDCCSNLINEEDFYYDQND
jgi:hypothetical protein